MAKNGNVHPSRIFKGEKEFEKAWNEYKEYKDSQSKKWAKVQYVGKDGRRVEEYPPMPYDLDGFVVWYKNKYGHYIRQYIDNQDGYYDDFIGIVTHVKSERDDNIKTGTLLGHFNASMGNRISGQVDKIENTNKSVTVLNIDPFSDSE